MRLRFLVVVASLAGSSCGEIREKVPSPGPIAAVTYVDQIEPLLAKSCVSCHWKKKPGGSYDLSSWRGLLGPGSDLVRNAIAGEAKSVLLTRLLRVKAGDPHQGLLSAAELELLRRWIVDQKLSYSRLSYHPAAWLDASDRSSVRFHGGALRKIGWDVAACRKCHGDKLDGGKAKSACTTCHEGGFEGCATCHGQGNEGAPGPDVAGRLDPQQSRGVGAHAIHSTSTLFGKITCDQCHQVPGKIGDKGHLFDDDTKQTTDLRAEVKFSARANADGVKATYALASGSCTVYCHGASIGAKSEPKWNDQATGKCGDTCHAVPFTLGGPNCAQCHPQVVAACKPGEAGCLAVNPTVGVRFLKAEDHGDGESVVGKKGAEGKCWGCHGTQASAGAPGPDLDGTTARTSVGVGMHEDHLKASRFRQPIPCATCHRVPIDVKDQGHIDDDRPAEVVFDAVASGRGVGSMQKPSWDRSTATCSNVHCHALDGASVKVWSWTAEVQGGLGCNSCHGLPPARLSKGGAHTAGTACGNASCHGGAYDNNGNLDPAKHIDGKVEVP